MQHFSSPKQIKAARALLGWSQNDLARKARLAKQTIFRLENQDSLNANMKTIALITSVLNEQGVVFIQKDNELGVVLVEACKK